MLETRRHVDVTRRSPQPSGVRSAVSTVHSVCLAPVGQSATLAATALRARRDYLPHLPVGSMFVGETPERHSTLRFAESERCLQGQCHFVALAIISRSFARPQDVDRNVTSVFHMTSLGCTK